MDRHNIKKSSNGDANQERFIRIAEQRVNKILDDFDSLAKCSNRRNYSYTDADVKKIFLEIERKSKEIKSMFQETSFNKKIRFKLTEGQ